MQTILDFFMKPEVLAIVAGVLMFFVRTLLKDRYEKNEAIFEQAVTVAYNVVNEIAKRTPNTVDDKVAMGLKALQEYLATHRVAASPAQLERAKLIFKSMPLDPPK